MIIFSIDPVSYALWAILFGIVYSQQQRITKLEYELSENLKLWNNNILKRAI